jgi:hypothetical protein
MPANRRDRRLRGTHQPTQAAPVLAYSQPPEGGLNPDQAALLKARPKTLPLRQKLAYGRQVRLAPWLTPGDREMLIAWVRATDLYNGAAKAFDRCMADPVFADPSSDTAKLGMNYHRIVTRQAAVVIALAHKLGFSPAGRLALGITTRPTRAPADSNNPWSELRLLPGGREL